MLIFHPIQWICFNIFGYGAHKKSVDLLNFFILNSLKALNIKTKFVRDYELPTDRPLLVVSNHQSLYDIPGFVWHLREHHAKFISKIELGKGIPSISYNLNHGGSILIDRKHSRQSLPALKKFGSYIEEHNYAAIIFPEGTRSRDGKLNPFNTLGFKILLKSMPNALIVPVAIENSWKIVAQESYPMARNINVSWTFLPPIEPNKMGGEELLQETEQLILNHLKQ